MNFAKFFEGKKTYAAAAVLFVFALLGGSGVIDETTFLAIAATAVSAIAAALRMAITTAQKETDTSLLAAANLYGESLKVRGEVLELQAAPPDPTLVQALRDTVEKAIVENLNASRVPDLYRRLNNPPPMTGEKIGVVLLCILGLMASTATAAAAPPVPVLRVIVNGESYELPEDRDIPIKVIAGDTLTFDLSASEEADRYFVLLENRRPGQRELSTRDKWVHADLRTRAGEYHLKFIVSNPDTTVELKRAVQVLCKEPTLPDEPDDPPQPTPTPNPVPNPIPPPQPSPLPHGEYGIAEKVAAIVRKIDSPTRAAQAGQLADAAEGLAAQIAAGTVNNATEVLTRIGAGIKALNAPAWSAAASEFAAEMKTTWQAHSAGRLKLTATGGMVDPAGWSALLREMAMGARSVK